MSIEFVVNSGIDEVKTESLKINQGNQVSRELDTVIPLHLASSLIENAERCRSRANQLFEESVQGADDYIAGSIPGCFVIF